MKGANPQIQPIAGWSLFLFAAIAFLLAFSPSPAGAAGTGTISGRVTDASNNPVVGACVSATNSDGNGSGNYTDENGNYSVGFLESRDYRIQFSRCGSESNVLDEWYDDAQTREEATLVAATNGANTPGINAQLAAGGSISGTVLNGPGGPHQDTCVRAESEDGYGTGRTDADGNYRVIGLVSGDYTVEFRRCNSLDNVISEFYPDKTNSDDAALVPVTAGSETPDIDGELAAGGSISGRYQVESPVAPVFCGGSLSIYDSDGEQLESIGFPAGTGAGGNYVFDRLETGDYRVGYDFQCMGELDFGMGYSETAFYRGKDSLADATPIHVTKGSARPGINILQDGGASISGRVTDEKGNPLADICVDTFDSQEVPRGSVRTGPDGSYAIDQFTAGTFILKFSDCLDPESKVVPEFYDDKTSFEEAVPIALADGQDLSGIDAELKAGDPDPPDPGTAKLALKVKGPAKARKGKRVAYRVRISNPGDDDARRVQLKVEGKGVRFSTTVGQIPAGSARTLNVRFRPKRSGKPRITFTVTSANATKKTAKRRLTVRKSKYRGRDSNPRHADYDSAALTS